MDNNENKNNDVKWYSDKRFKYGTYSTVISIVTIALLIAVNLIVGLFDFKIDMTQDDLFSIGDSTKTVLDDVNTDIKIYTTFKTNIDDNIITRVNEMLDVYKQNCRYISVENTDLYLHPDFARQFTEQTSNIDVNSIIVEGSGRYKVIGYDDYYNGNGKFSLESVLTSAIQFVSMESSPTIYQIVGHNEYELSDFASLSDKLNLSNYSVKTLNLLKEEIPPDCTALLITPGELDFSAEEADKVKTYLANDGRLFCMLGGPVYDNVRSIINAYGVDVSDRYVCEGDEKGYIQYPQYISPQLQDHETTSQLISSGFRLLTYPNVAVKRLELAKQDLQIESVLTTTDKGYIKAEGNSSANKEAGDEEGTFDIAAAITDSTYTDTSHVTKLVVAGFGYGTIEDSADAMVNSANSTFIVNVFNWLNDNESTVSISAKNLDDATILVDSATQNNIKIISWGVIPGLLFAAGFAVWIVRRNK